MPSCTTAPENPEDQLAALLDDLPSGEEVRLSCLSTLLLFAVHKLANRSSTGVNHAVHALKEQHHTANTISVV